MKNLRHIWYDARCRPEVSFSSVSTHTHDLKVNVLDFEILHQSFLRAPNQMKTDTGRAPDKREY